MSSDERFRALDGPADDELEFAGPGLDRNDGRFVADPHLPGEVDHSTAAAGAGALGVVLLGIAGVLKRRSARRRFQNLEA